ncbi:hypothetical protein EDE05_112176, partial [Neorhizobium sp. R1-B]|uniref:hypothetical protein n=1 Tax=Neorhizobium sp. R1-B TaxID=2485162 RepID=UPI0010EF4E4D
MLVVPLDVRIQLLHEVAGLAQPNTAGTLELQHKQSKNLSAPPRGEFWALTHIWCSCRTDQAGLKQIKLSAAVHLALHQ